MSAAGTIECPAESDIDALLSQGLDDARAAEISTHLESCVRCRSFAVHARENDRILAELRDVLGIANAELTPDPAWPICHGFRLVRELGRGGAGVVYEAIQSHPHRRVALKFLASGKAARPPEIDRFRREIDAIGAISHPGIARAICSGTAVDGTPFMAMEYVEGSDFSAFAGVHRDWPTLARTLRELCEAVAAAHAAGIVHRDLKPTNVLVTDQGTVTLIDFGLASFGDRRAMRLTATGEVRGTPAYMSPERFRGRTADERADIYSLGIIAWEALAGHHPFADFALDWFVLARAMSESAPPPLSSVRADVPPKTSALIAAATSSDPEHRPSASEFAAAFSDLHAFSIGAPAGRRRVRAVVALGGLIVVTAGAFAVLSSRQPAVDALVVAAHLGSRHLDRDFTLPPGTTPEQALAAATLDLAAPEERQRSASERRRRQIERALLMEVCGAYSDAIQEYLDLIRPQGKRPGGGGETTILRVRMARCHVLMENPTGAEEILRRIQTDPRAAAYVNQDSIAIERAAVEGDLLRVRGDLVSARRRLLETLEQVESVERRGPAPWLKARVLEALIRVASDAGDHAARADWEERLASLSSLPG